MQKQVVNASTEKAWLIHPQVAVRTLEEHLIVVLADAGEVLLLNSSGALVWSGVEQGRSEVEIACELAATFSIPLERALPDVRALLDQLEALQALERSADGCAVRRRQTVGWLS